MRRQRGEKGGVLLRIVVGILVCIAVLAAGATLLGFYVVRNTHVEETQSASGKAVEIHTPFGSVHVNEHSSAPRAVDLPVFPGAQPVSSDAKSVNVELSLGGDRHFGLSAAEYTTGASVDEVRAFYRKEFPNGEFRFDDKGSLVMKIKGSGEWQQRIVSLRTRDGATRISLVQTGDVAVN